MILLNKKENLKFQMYFRNISTSSSPNFCFIGNRSTTENKFDYNSLISNYFLILQFTTF
jgi:hypothetical protein